MRKIMTMVAIAAAALLGLQSCEKNDKLIGESKLPSAAQTFLQENFPSEAILSVVKDYDDGTHTYKVSLSDGTYIEFKKNGEWKEIENRTSGIPESAIPAKIMEYINVNYPDNFIIDIEHDRHYDVELDSGLDLDFNSKGEFLRIDL
jgi:hypothetical protein